MPLLNGTLENLVSWAAKISRLWCWPVAEPVAKRMEKFRAEGELPGDITLKIRRPVQRAPGGKQQMLMLGEINHRAEVERGFRASAGKRRGARHLCRFNVRCSGASR